MDDVSSEGTVTSSGGFSHGEIVELSEVVSPKDPKLLEERKPAPLTRKQIGELRRMYITNVNGTVTVCGHKDNFSKTEKRAGKMPSNNCVDCWTAYFMTSVDLEGIHVVLTQKDGVRKLTAQRGVKFVKAFHGFLTSKLMPMLNAEANAHVDELVPADPTVIYGGIINGGNGSEAPNQGTEIHSTQPAVETVGQEARHDEHTGTTRQQEHCACPEHTVGPTDAGL
jgi:hypothetical protein